MRAAQINDLQGSFGTIGHAGIWDRVRRYRLTRLYLDARQASAGALDLIRGQQVVPWHVEAGIIRVPEWGDVTYAEWLRLIRADQRPPALSAIDLARTLDADLVMLKCDQQQCAVLANIEAHDGAYPLEWLREWRRHRPARQTGWALEGLQGGRLPRELVLAIAADPNLQVIPEAYTGNMAPMDADQVRADLIEAGIPRGRVAVYYDGARPPGHWDGVMFTLERLPL